MQKYTNTWQQVLTSVKRTWSDESLTVSVGVPHVDSRRTFVGTVMVIITIHNDNVCDVYDGEYFFQTSTRTLPISEPIELTVSSWSEQGTEIIGLLSPNRSSSVYPGLVQIPQQQPTIPNFADFEHSCLKDLTGAIFFKSMGFKDIKYDIPVIQI